MFLLPFSFFLGVLFPNIWLLWSDVLTDFIEVSFYSQFTPQKFSIKHFFWKQRIWSHLLKKSLMVNFIFFLQWLSCFYVLFSCERKTFIIAQRSTTTTWFLNICLKSLVFLNSTLTPKSECKKTVLKISQNSQEIISGRISF